MDYSIGYLELENFKSYSELQRIPLSDLSVFLGANSSGKSTALQALLVLKQTLECNSHDVDLLLSGKYVALGDFDDVINDKTKKNFSICVGFFPRSKDLESPSTYSIKWVFTYNNDKALTELTKIIISIDQDKLVLYRISSGKYQLEHNGDMVPLMLSVRDLHLSRIYIRYDEQLNHMLVDYINSIKRVFNGDKTELLPKSDFVSPMVVSQFYYSLLTNYNQLSLDNITMADESVSSLSLGMVELIDSYCQKNYPFNSDYYELPKDIKNRIIYAYIEKTGETSKLQELFKKYEVLLKDYKLNPVTALEGEEIYHNIFLKNISEGADSNGLKDIVWSMKMFYNDFENHLKSIMFLGPIREKPQGIYSIGFEQNPKYVGPTGSFFASVLMFEKKNKEYVLPDGVANTSLVEALNEWANHLNIASSIDIARATSFGIKVNVLDTQNKTADIMNVGIGTSQVLPVLITGLVSEENEVLIFEQPELHLHPFAQGRLADFFVSLALHKRVVIIETHSEAIILRLRYHVLQNHCNKDSIAIDFFQNSDGTKVSACNISGYGTIDYPDDFRDETQELLNDILMASIKKGIKL